MPQSHVGRALRVVWLLSLAASPEVARADEISVEEAAKRAHDFEAQVTARQADRDAAQSVLDAQRSRLESLQTALEALPESGSDDARTKLAASKKEVEVVVAESEQALKDAQTRLQSTQVAATVAVQSHREAIARESKDGCGVSGNRSFCLMAGLFAATGSVAAFQVPNAFRGQTSQQLVSFAIPFAGARWSFGKVLALDVGLLTSVFNKEISLASGNTRSSACRVQSTTFERYLPCEGDAVIRPYGALFVGPSLGSNDVTWISLYVVTGWARTAQDPTANYFVGLMLGALGVQKVVTP